MISVRWIGVAAVLVSWLQVSALAQLSIRTVALSGDPAPGTEPGVAFSYLWGGSINESGQTAILGYLTGPGVNSSNREGIWSEGSGALSLVTRSGSVAPGDPLSRPFYIFDWPTLNDAGHTVFMGLFPFQDSGHGFWTDRSEALEAIAVTGAPAPVEPGVNFQALYTSHAHYLATPGFNNASQSAFFAQLAGNLDPPNSSSAVFSEGLGELNVVAREAYPAPGTDPPANFDTFGTSNTIGPVINDDGQVAFRARVTGAYGSGVWAEGSAGLALVAHQDAQAPDTPAGVLFHDFTEPDINNAGSVAFGAELTGVGVDQYNNTGLWLGHAGFLELIVREGSQAAGLPEGVLYGNFDVSEVDPILNHSDRMAFAGYLTPGGIITTENDSAVWRSDDDGVHLLAWEGAPAPGTEPGVVFASFDPGEPFESLAMNTPGQVLIDARLRGPGVTGDNDAGLWLASSSGDVSLVLRKGQSFEVRPGEYRILDYFVVADLGAGGEDGRLNSFNDQGQIAIAADFTDGSSGVFILTIPEPATLGLAFLSMGAFHLRRRA
jgi:hypothetical protein